MRLHLWRASNSMTVIKFWKAYDAAPEIRRAEKGAAGTMPVAAFQFCEAMRKASSLGWYIYPPKDISLLFDGRETFYHDEDQWYPLKSTNLEDDFRDHWRTIAPPGLTELDPPYLSELFVPGAIQIWSGYFVETAKDWCVHVGSIPNYDIRSSLSLYEGIVDTDVFRPWPLFINLRLLATNVEIFISKDKPLFQLQAIPNMAFESMKPDFSTTEALTSDCQSFDWDSAHNTIRDSSTSDARKPGAYATKIRKNK